MQHEKSPYTNFVLMLLASFFIMYGVMFLNVEKFDHIYTSLTRTFMTLLMVAPMALLKLIFMKGMYPNKSINVGIGIGSVIIFIVALFLLRTQKPISDKQWMEAMIPHHSSAIMTSSNADLNDPEVKQLAEDIIIAQEREINQMKAILARLKKE